MQYLAFAVKDCMRKCQNKYKHAHYIDLCGSSNLFCSFIYFAFFQYLSAFVSMHLKLEEFYAFVCNLYSVWIYFMWMHVLHTCVCTNVVALESLSYLKLYSLQFALITKKNRSFILHGIYSPQTKGYIMQQPTTEMPLECSNSRRFTHHNKGATHSLTDWMNEWMEVIIIQRSLY